MATLLVMVSEMGVMGVMGLVGGNWGAGHSPSPTFSEQATAPRCDSWERLCGGVLDSDSTILKMLSIIMHGAGLALPRSWLTSLQWWITRRSESSRR